MSCFEFRSLESKLLGRQIDLEREGAVRRVFTLSTTLMTRLLSCVASIWIACILPACSAAQNPVGGADQVKPLPGGHSYIEGINETVNPSNGQVSLRISVPVPKGRQLTIPFSFAYDSSGMWPITPNWGVSSVMYIPGPDGDPVPIPLTYGVTWLGYGSSAIAPLATDSLSINGWSYTLPHYSVAVHNAVANYYEQYQCSWLTDFQFYDPSGGSHPLLLGYLSPDNPSLQNICNQNLGMQVHNYPTGGDNEVRAAFNGQYSTTPVVTDSEGTSYSFAPATPTIDTTHSDTAFGVATKIEDRNGNQVNLVQSGTSYSYVDTKGHTTLSISGMGGSTDTISSSLFPAPYYIGWSAITTANPPPPPNMSWVNDNPGGQCAFLAEANGAVSRSEVTSIILPNGDVYGFDYDPVYALLSRITYPSGAYVSYTWGFNPQSEETQYKGIYAEGRTGPPLGGAAYTPCAGRYDVPAIVERDVSYDGQNIALKQTFTYSTTWAPSVVGSTDAWTSKTTTQTDTDLIAGTSTVTIYTYSPVWAPLDPNTTQFIATAPSIPVESQVNYGNLMTKTEGWISADKKICEVDTYNTISKGTFTDYQQFGSGPNLFLGGPDEQRLYDFGSVNPTDCTNFGIVLGSPASSDTWPQAALLIRTVTTYQNLSPVLQYPFVQPQTPLLPLFMAAPSTVTTTGTGGNQSSTTFVYDGAPVAAVSGVLSHDDVNYGTNAASPRGNVTSIIKSIDSQSSVTTQYTYDELGNLVTLTDANGNPPTQYSYDPQSAYAYLSQITRPATNGVSHVSTFQYDSVTGNLLESADENSQITDYAYNDPLGRLTSVQEPAVNGQRPTTQYLYIDGRSPSTTTTNPIGVQNQIAYDGFGRPTLSTLLTDPQGPTYSLTTYDGEGRVHQQWNPTRCNLTFTTTSCPGETSFGITTYTYDQLGRNLVINHPDGTAINIGYNANVKHITDENSNSWKYTMDASGAMTSVKEPGSLVTNYSYDSLGNLLGVNQQGQAANGDTPRLRTFSYDSLSRLRSSTNPETGEIDYGYDANGNLISKKDARGITASMSYDVLNRLVGKAYYNLAGQLTGDLADCFQYDAPLDLGSPYSIGHLTFEWTQPGTCPSGGATGLPLSAVTIRVIDSYDAMGRITSDSQTPFAAGPASGTFQYGYNAASQITQYSNGLLSNPMEIDWNSTYDATGRLANVAVTKQPWPLDIGGYPPTLFSADAAQNSNSPTYDPMGHLISAKLGVFPSLTGSGILQSRQYDNRGRVISEQDGALPTASSGSITIQGNEQSTSTGGGNYAALSIDVIPAPYYQPLNICVNNALFTTITLSPYQSNSAGLASAIAGALNVSSSLVTAQTAGTVPNSYYGTLTVLQITSKVAGSAGNMPFSYGSGSGGSCTGGAAGTLSGGTDDSTTTYDSGSIVVSLGRRTVVSSWGQGDTVQSVLANLSTAIQNSLGTTSISGNTLTFEIGTLDSDANSTLGVYVSDSANFATPSFSATATGMSLVTGTSSNIFYSYTVPSGGYDGVGNLKSVNDLVMGSWNYSYDNLNRLTTATSNSAAYLGTNISGAVLNWQYDSFGNRLLQSTTNAGLPSGSVQYAGPNNQASGIGLASNPGTSVTSLQYDAAGNLTGQNGGATSMFDAEGRLCATTNATGGYTQYIYDAEGRRVAKGSINSLSCDLSSNQFSVTNEYLLGLNGEQVTEIDGQGTWLHSNTFTGGTLLATYDSAGPHFQFTDWLGTRRAQTTYAGVVEQTCQSLPFGDGLSCNGSDVTEHHFTGKERDTESGLDYFKYRMYASSMGRWMSPDPSGLTHADLSNPQSLNLYNYVGNSPLTRTDLDGLCWKGFQWACNAIQSLDNGFHGLGFQTNASVDKEQHTANQLLHHDGISTEGLSRRQVRKAYKLDMAFGSMRTGPYDDGTVRVTRIRPTAAQARAIWEKATGGKVPYDENLGRFYDMAHKTPIADGGSPTDPNNLEPMLHSDHMDQHMQNGDFARWGARGSTPGEPGQPVDTVIEPGVPVEPTIMIEPIDPIP